MKPADRRAAPRPVRVAEIVLLAAACAAAAFLLAHLIAFEYGRDQAIYAVMAGAVLRGEAPYLAAWDFKPPGIYFVYALAKALFGSGMHAVRILEALGLLSLGAAFVVFSRRHAGSARAGIIAAAIAVFGYVHLDFWFTGQPESFGAAALAWALVCATYAPGDGRARRLVLAWAGAGALFAAAGLLKPPLAGGAVSSLALILFARRGLWPSSADTPAPARQPLLPAGGGRRPVRAWVPIAAFAAGGLLPAAALLLYFAAHGALDELYGVFFEFVPGYTALDFEAAGLPAAAARAVTQWLFAYSPFLAPGLALAIFLPPLHARERAGLLHVFGASVFILAGVALQAKFFKYHYAAALALAALPAGWGLWKLWLRVRGSALGWAGFAAALAVLAAGWVPGLDSPQLFWSRCGQRHAALLDSQRRAAINNELYSLGDVNAGANRKAAQWIANNTPPDATLFVWGFEPILYELSRRRPASRYIYNVPLRAGWAAGTARRTLLEELDRARPAAVVVVQNDVLPRVVGNDRDSVQALSDFPELGGWIEAGYQHAVTFEDLMILRRKATAP